MSCPLGTHGFPYKTSFNLFQPFGQAIVYISIMYVYIFIFYYYYYYHCCNLERKNILSDESADEGNLSALDTGILPYILNCIDNTSLYRYSYNSLFIYRYTSLFIYRYTSMYSIQVYFHG